MNQPLPAFDSNGKHVQIGAVVRIPRLPLWLLHDLPGDDVALLRAVEGTLMKVVEIDESGYLWFGANNEGRWFCLRPEEVAIDLAERNDTKPS